MHGYIIFVVFIYAFYETQPNTKRNQELNQDKAINCEKQIVHLSMIHGLKIVEIILNRLIIILEHIQLLLVKVQR